VCQAFLRDKSTTYRSSGDCALLSLFRAVIYCPDLIDVENATRDSNETHYDKAVIYSCLPGYQYPDKQKQKLVRCTENETWTDFPPPCEGFCCLFIVTRAVARIWCEKGHITKRR